jgi:hypothetical protein
VHPGNHHVLVISWITNNRHVVSRISRQIFKLATIFDPEFDRISGIV